MRNTLNGELIIGVEVEFRNPHLLTLAFYLVDFPVDPLKILTLYEFGSKATEQLALRIVFFSFSSGGIVDDGLQLVTETEVALFLPFIVIIFFYIVNIIRYSVTFFQLLFVFLILAGTFVFKLHDMAHVVALLFGKAFKWGEILFEVFYEGLVDDGFFELCGLAVSLEDQEDDIPKEIFLRLEVLLILGFLYLERVHRDGVFL